MTNTKKIKSIRTLKDFPFMSYKQVRKLLKTAGPNMIQEALKYPEFFEIEYEPELLKRPDGSLISEPKDEDCIIRIAIVNYSIAEINYSQNLKWLIKQGLIFLPEDKELAEKKANMLSKQLEIKNEIDKLNAEQGWNYKIALDELRFFEQDGTKIITIHHYPANRRDSKQYMSPKTAEVIVGKYTQDEIKQYLGIII